MDINKRELSYNEAKALLAKIYSGEQQQNSELNNNINIVNEEFSQELEPQNYTNQKSANLTIDKNK